MYTLTLNAKETATLLLLNAAVLDVINGDISEDTITELKATQADLEHILFKEEKALAVADQSNTRANRNLSERISRL